MRPFDFMVPFWGKRYREYFVNFCLPSLLAPNNLALLRAEDGHRFLIATTVEDWNAIERLPIMLTLRSHATPVWIEVADPVQASATAGYARYVLTIRHQNYCQKKLLDAGFAGGGYGSLVFPDQIYSDSMVACLKKWVAAGYQLVIMPAMRQVEEDVLHDLSNLGFLPHGIELSVMGKPLSIPQRVLADLAVRHLHPEMAAYNQDKAPSLPTAMPFLYWPMADDGLILHSFQADTRLIDFAFLPANHTECLDHGIVENVYFRDNFSHCERVHVVQDSDEFILVSLTPRAVNWAPAAEQAEHLPRWAAELRRLATIRESMRFYAAANHDVIRRDLFRLPIRWRGGELGPAWLEQEQRIGRLINRAVGDYYKVSTPPNKARFPSRSTWLDLLLAAYALRASLLQRHASLKARCGIVSGQLREAARRLFLALRGDAAARRWLIWRTQVAWRRLQGHVDHPPRPDVSG